MGQLVAGFHDLKTSAPQDKFG